ncbi:MAG: hypothetical protein UW39_C0008G0003 [Parcubacteria group bacterium GW2011_GWC2_44_17]|nr:MAG: hypothetical protein UW39_C0008G0003 [Parcubacteria group bacterium GW2011_GWC2_44_17]KKT50145.1 MAG: hypothetical protein UW40_C0009G0014 [Parcubacteria group bacterium GW2011_GWF2_44_17]HCA67312.1 hypothetical protein [Candidatus Jacksonbacteria bacterium]HCE86898.1 hypothetical protein [Candidatus Jacksonbacteria bacterium]
MILSALFARIPNNSMLFLAQIAWFILPSGSANITAALSARLFPKWRLPVDFGNSWRNVRIFGDHKTWRGLITGIIAGGAVFFLQRSLSSSPFFSALELFDYKKAPWFLGFVMGFGALFGDLAKSFIKRRLAIAPGRQFIIADQIDWILGLHFVLPPFIYLNKSVILLSLVMGGLLHVAVKYIGWRNGLDVKVS